MQPKEEISVYIHWPFCISKCPYCDFNSHVARNIENYDVWTEAYCQEISYYNNILRNKKVSSIFFGGGTPSLMPAHLIYEIILAINCYADIDSKTEITMEANPTSSEISNFKSFRRAGINRISIGIQSFNNKYLKSLGRQYKAAEARKAAEAAATVFPARSLDIIYAIPGQNETEIINDITEAASLSPNHLSLYQLTIEKGTEYYTLYKKNKLHPVNSDLAASFYNTIRNILLQHNITAYEISNYCKPGNMCSHNMNYWTYKDYLGIGPGAHGRFDKKNYRYATVNRHYPEEWLMNIQKHGHALQQCKILNNQTIAEEMVLMGLRTIYGVSYDRFKEITQQNLNDYLDLSQYQMLIEKNIIFTEQNNIKMNPDYFLITDSVTKRILK